MGPHLLALPGEVKNRIYELCIDEEVTVELTTDQVLNTLAQWKRKWTVTIFEGRPEDQEGDRKEFALTKTCRQIRFEILPILAELGHSCLYVPLSSRFSASMIAPLPQAYVGNVREIHLWKTTPTLKNQTLTRALPALERIILEFHSQSLANLLGGQDHIRQDGDWSRWFSGLRGARNVISKLKQQVVSTYQQESVYLEKTEPDRKVALVIRVPYGSFRMSAMKRGGLIKNFESDHTLVSNVLFSRSMG